MKSFRIVYTGGGSGGHVYPLIAVAEALQKVWSQVVSNELEMYYLGPDDSYDEVFAEHDIAVRPILSGKLRRYFSLENFLDAPKAFVGFIQALWRLYVLMPDVIFSKGGTGALPVVIAGWFYRIPVIIHESDSHPGLTNLFSSRFASRVCISFADASAYFDDRKVVLTGTPIRRELIEGRTTKELAKDALGFTSSRPLIFIVGGSQGAMRINTFIVENLKKIMEMTQVMHQTGAANFSEIDRLAQAALADASFENRYEAKGFLDDAAMRTALTAADLVIARAGSGSLFEIASFGAPSVLIPLAGSANGHQNANARVFAANGAALVIEEPNLLPGIFLIELKKLFGDPALMEKMGVAAQGMFMPNAANDIAREIMKLAL